MHVHCVAHRAALVASDASKHTGQIARFLSSEAVNGVYTFFKYSAARHGRLLRLHQALNDSDFKSLKEPRSVRWLSLSKAVDSVFVNWPTLVLSLGEEAARGNPVADGLLRQITTVPSSCIPFWYLQQQCQLFYNRLKERWPCG